MRSLRFSSSKSTKVKKNNFNLPTALAIHDLSCFGKCALTVILPTLSAMGVQTVPIPTAFLSTHTGGFEGFYFEDLTGAMDKISEHLLSVGVEADAIYTGFLGSEEQISTVSGIIDRFGAPDGEGNKPLILVDPVMGDDGRLYSTYNDIMVEGMKRLCEKADVITPNVTEACFLTGEDIKDTSDMSEGEATEYADRLADKLKAFGAKRIAITGIHYGGSKVGTYGYDNGSSFLYGREHVKKSYPGTGDLFASVLLGEMLRGKDFKAAIVSASEFTGKVIEYSSRFDTPIRNGVAFEPFLSELGE